MQLQFVLKLNSHLQEWIFVNMTIPVCMNIHTLAAINGDLLIFNDPKAGNRWHNQRSLTGNRFYSSLVNNKSKKCGYEQTKGREEQYFPQQSETQKQSSILYVVRDNGKQQIPLRCSQFMQQLKTMIDDVRQQESAEIHNSKMAFKEELDKTAESKKNASQLTQFIIPYPKTVLEQIAWLRGLLSQEIKNHKQSIKSYIDAFELKQKEKQAEYSITCLKQFTLIFQQQRLEAILHSTLYQSAMSELIALVLLDKTDLLKKLTVQEIHNYERIAQFNKSIMLKFENKVKYPQKVYSIQGMINYNVMALFLWKNYRYRQKYGYSCLIPQRIANTLFDLTSIEYNRFEERFLDAIELIELRFIDHFETALNLYCLIALTQKLSIMQRTKYKYKKTQQIWERVLLEPKSNPNISFQFCEIALFPFFSTKTSEKKNNKIIQQITREMQEIAGKTDMWLTKTVLLKIKNDNNLSLKSTVQYFNKVLQNPERIVILHPNQKIELYKQLQHIKWIYFTANTMYNNKSKDLQFYLQEKKLSNQLNPSTIVAFKMAMQRYKLMQRVNTSIVQVLRLAKRPITFINRHVFSYTSIKGKASHDKESLISNPATKTDIFYTHILGVRNASVAFSATTDSKLIDNQYSAFLLDFCGKKLNIKDEGVVLYQFEHNGQVTWEALTCILRGFKTKMQADIIIVNNVKMFIIHYFINISVEWLLRTRSQELTTENFGQMIKDAQAYIFDIILKAKEPIQKLMDETVNENLTYQGIFTSLIENMLQILMENQEGQVFLKNLQKFQHCNHTVQYLVLPLTQSKLDKKKGTIHHYESISLQKKADLRLYMHQQFKKKYIYFDDCDKEEVNTNFSLLLEKYSMVSMDVRNILSRCSKFILIDEVIVKEIERQYKGTTEDASETKKFYQQIELLKSIFEHERQKIDSISPGERQIFLKRALCMSKYPSTQLKLQH